MAVAEQEVVRIPDIAVVAAGKLPAEAAAEVAAEVDSQPAAVAVAADQVEPVAEVDTQQAEVAVEDRTGILAAGRTPSEDRQAAQVRTANNRVQSHLMPHMPSVYALIHVPERILSEQESVRIGVELGLVEHKLAAVRTVVEGELEEPVLRTTEGSSRRSIGFAVRSHK